jgi:F-type H+-transporting ATPase subunit b
MMFYLMDFNPIKPDFGLLLWTTIIFGLFWFLIGKFAFRPISNALKKREEDIQSSLDTAKHAKEEMMKLKAENDKLLARAREERAMILREAKDAGNQMVFDAKQKAKEEASKIVASAKIEIDNQKKHALSEVKSQVGIMALDIAEKVLRKELKSDPAQEKYVEDLVTEIKLN